MLGLTKSIILFFLLESATAGQIQQRLQTTPEISKDIVSNNNHDHPESYMDLIYGGLVNGDREIAYAMEKLNDGSLKPPMVDYNAIDANAPITGEFNANCKSAKALIKHKATKRIYGSSKLHLPEIDYTEDLWSTREAFNGLNTYANSVPKFCLNEANLRDESYNFDVAIIGAGFDTATSYRPGARFGPRGIRLASKRLGGGGLPTRGYLNSDIDDYYEFNDESDEYGRDPFMGLLKPYDTLKVVDCGDVPMMATDNRIALDQLYRGSRLVHKYSTPASNYTASTNTKYFKAPRIITLGGDHTITLMTVKSAYEAFGEPITVLHFDSHIDTWRSEMWGGAITDYSRLNHGSFLHFAAEKGYLNTNNSMHIGIRGRLMNRYVEMDNDASCGFETIWAREVDRSGVKGIVDQIKQRVYGTTQFRTSAKKDTPVYITFDIDVLDPVYAPATGTQEPGGFTVREILNIIDGLEGINLVGADLVEVSPIYDNPGETTCLNSAHIIDAFLGLMASYKVRHTESE